MTSRLPLRLLLLLGVPISALGAGAGCRPDFAPYNRLVDLRVLAIQSEPPAPAAGETAALSALVYAPPGSTNVSFAWSWCPFPGPAGQGHRCLVTEADIAGMFPDQAAQLPPFDLGTGTTASLANTIDPAVLGALCAGTPGSPPISNCDNGFPFQIALTVTNEDQSGKSARVDAVVTGHWRFDAQTAPNSNPEIEQLTTTPGNQPDGGVPEPITELSAPPTPLPRDVGTSIHAVVVPTAAESYQGLNDDRALTTLRERLFLTWFVETGETDDSRTSFSPPQPDDPAEEKRRFAAMQKNIWTPALSKDYPADTARLFVVIHDNRGGVSWKDGIVNLDPTP